MSTFVSELRDGLNKTTANTMAVATIEANSIFSTDSSLSLWLAFLSGLLSFELFLHQTRKGKARMYLEGGTLDDLIFFVTVFLHVALK